MFQKVLYKLNKVGSFRCFFVFVVLHGFFYTTFALKIISLKDCSLLQKYKSFIHQ